jgi:hypothetical protein
MVTEEKATQYERAFGLANDAELLASYAKSRESIKQHQDILGRLEQELLTRMNERGATAIQTETHIATLEPNVTYAQDAFTPLLEILPTDELKACYAPAHEETVKIPAKWDTTKTKAAARRVGDAALRIVEHAKLEGAPRLKVTAKAKGK